MPIRPVRAVAWPPQRPGPDRGRFSVLIGANGAGGSAGNDTLVGGAGNDTMTGNDNLSGPPGAGSSDTADGGAGTDVCASDGPLVLFNRDVLTSCNP